MIRAPSTLPEGRFVLPGNRWDLLDRQTPAQAPTVSVIVPYFQAQRELDLLLTALSVQTYRPDRLEVIVADDGSAEPVRLDALRGVAGRVVRQENLGFRAGAARNLGAAAGTGEVLVFLDADTSPESEYIERRVRSPALAPDVVVTARRRHADFSGWTPARLREWLLDQRGAGSAPPELAEPEWLRSANLRAGHLRDIDGESYRYVISAVLACSRRLFTEVGGFDETLVGYGGEDWELAHRCLCAGAVLAHVEHAVAWHDGAEWAQRGTADERRRAKNAETAALAQRIPDFIGSGAWSGRPNFIVEIGTDGVEPAAVIIAATGVLSRSSSALVNLVGADAGLWKGTYFPAEPRVAGGQVSPVAAASARVVVAMSQPMIIDAGCWPLLQQIFTNSDVGRIVVHLPEATLTATATRARRRADRWQSRWPARDLLSELFETVSLGATDAGVTAVPGEPDLAHELRRLGQG